jgi:hypothetical protein
MSSPYLSSGEKVILNDHGSVLKPIQGSGQLYLTDRRVVLIHRSGFVRTKETPLLDIEIPQISYLRIEGLLKRSLVLGVKAGNGQIVPYKIHVSREEKWHSEIYGLKGGSSEKTPPIYPKIEGSGGKQRVSKYCEDCGEEVKFESKFCPSCGEQLGS